MKLIDMGKALSELCLSHKDIIYIDKNETAERIRKIPSIDIVRCKECKHGTYYEEAEMYICNANDQDLYEAEHFCSYGERREP